MAEAHRRLERDPSDPSAKLLLGEAHLCAGLDDDPWALDRAIEILHEVVRADSDDFFARLELADAVRKRYPFSDKAETLLLDCRELLGRAQVGAARSELARYIEQNLAAVRRALSRLHSRADSLRSAASLAESPSEVGNLAVELSLTGHDGAARARELLVRYLSRRSDDALSTYYRAEVLRGDAARSTVFALYRGAESNLCSRKPPVKECDLARWRLKQMQDSEREPSSIEDFRSDRGGDHEARNETSPRTVLR